MSDKEQEVFQNFITYIDNHHLPSFSNWKTDNLPAIKSVSEFENSFDLPTLNFLNRFLIVKKNLLKFKTFINKQSI
ncbi:hypothetical protein [Mesomycoplasma lagogenitalium]|uniref:Uncharacterized protein n=1 Tax=Mesomycoplasma lagogenitalium TaxID=171286 RepID=A0ABY8LUV7_9BACT|nr:hypothetical protein [Mesomycoplasma lagogenitalium]WGI36510.1 hypothetical protein QEG99_03530 [Mesomycoplasma lagogenitalium]